jgi:hypothetical protein
MMTAILGVSPTQKELLLFRARIFNGVMPAAGRDEKRVRDVNIKTFEQYKANLLPMLMERQVYCEMVSIVIANRKWPEKEKILMNILNI